MTQRTATLTGKKSPAPLVSGLLRRAAVRSDPGHDGTPSLTVDQTSLGRDFSQVPAYTDAPTVHSAEQSAPCPVFPRTCPFGGACHTCPLPVQAKLKIGQPGDKYEQEADRVAELVMRMPEPGTSEEVTMPGQTHGVRIQQACPECEDELRRQPLDEEEEEEGTLQAKGIPGRAPQVTPTLNRQINGLQGRGQPLPESNRAFFEPRLREVLHSPGQPLDPATRESMESRFGYDFSQVRVHTDTKAAESARAVNALACTAGNHVFFGGGQYKPGTSAGGKLLAHELTHVIQQRQGIEIRRKANVANPNRSSASYAISCPNPRAIRTAIRNARTMLSTTLRQITSGPTGVPEDPRLYTPMHYFYTLFFHVEPGLRSMRQITQIREKFQFIRQTLPSVRTQCVSNNHPMCRSGQFLHNAFAPIGPSAPRVLSICPSFFNNSAGEQARTIIHELAHNRLGAEHSGGRFITFDCSGTPVRTFGEAIDNAYVYDGFAYCMHAAASRRRRGSRAP